MKKKVLSAVAMVLFISCSISKNASRSANTTSSGTAISGGQVIKTDTLKKGLRSYKDIITTKAITQKGLFKVHKVDERWFFEIPDSLLNRSLLLVNRISKGSYNGPYTGYAGDMIGESILQFCKGPSNKLQMRLISYDVRTLDSSDNGLFQAIQNSNTLPIAASFDIKALSPDSSGFVIDVTDYINSDNEVFCFVNYQRGKGGFSLSGYQADKSYINTISSFPTNIEIKTIRTYGKGTGALPGALEYGYTSFELNHSLVLLPQNTMQPRYRDKRVGYFSWGYFNFDASQPVNINKVITRWRLEPRVEDIEKYKRGELVEPQKPIVYYIDPATPKKWVPYLMQGVKDWQKAFEKAGFKNAIYAMEAPKNDSTWSMEDARHSVIVYKASDIQNASGPQISDPRSGEILETHINWYHNVLKLLHDWYMIQAGPNDPAARTMDFNDTLMGRLIRYVCAHEVGHTLGLHHNFFASSTVPVDSLRSRSYVEANGYCPSIMDYARFNYVAQPEDKMPVNDLVPGIGVYDEWAIEWGYRWLPDLKTFEAEKNYMNEWITSRINKDNRLQFAGQDMYLIQNWDPKRQSEDLGDDAVKASHYGILNLKRIVPNLQKWSSVPDGSAETLQRMYDELTNQYKRYLLHVASNIGGITWMEKGINDKNEGVLFATREQQKAAVQFLQDELFTTPTWLLDDEIFKRSAGERLYWAGPGNMYFLMGLQVKVLTIITSQAAYGRLLMEQTSQKGPVYTLDDFFSDLKNGIFKELKNRAPIDIYRRNLQKIYVDRFIRQLDWKDESNLWTGEDNLLFTFSNTFSDVYPLLKAHLLAIQSEINKVLPGYKDRDSRLHLMEVRDRIKNALAVKANLASEYKESGTKSLFNLINMPPSNTLHPQRLISCWNSEPWKSVFEK